MHHNVAGPFAFAASPFAPIDTSKGPIANSRRAAALALAVQRAPLSWQGEQLFALADKFAAYISGERAEETPPNPSNTREGVPAPDESRNHTRAFRDHAGRMFIWDGPYMVFREVVYK